MDYHVAYFLPCYSEYNNNIFVTKDDLVYYIGGNKFQYIGFGHKNISEPTLIPELSYKQIIEISNGYTHLIARSIDGKLFSFGSNKYKQLYETGNDYDNRPKIIESLINENVIQVSCGGYHTIVLTQNEEVFGWGDNIWGQIGINSEEEFISIPTKIIGFNGEKIQSISCGSKHSMALTVNGNVFSWGDNDCGQLGINRNKSSSVPQMIEMSDKEVLFKKISCGQSHSILLSINNDIYYCGLNVGGPSLNNCKPHMILTNPKNYFSDILCQFDKNLFITLSQLEGICYIWERIEDIYIFRNNLILGSKKTQYKSCRKAMDEMMGINSEIKLENNININRFRNEFKEIDFSSKEGSFGVVFKAKKISDNKCYAIKRIEVKELEKQKLLNEIELMSRLKSEYIVKYENSWVESNENNENFLYIQMELCLKTLKQFNEELIKEFGINSLIDTPISFYIMSDLMTEVIEGLRFLHKNKIIHRDLKPQNILITEFKYGRSVKIADFGISCIHETIFTNNDFSGISHTGDVGDLKYIAPELDKRSDRLSGRLVYDEKVDIYSLGAIFEEFVGKFFLNETHHTIFSGLKNSKMKNLKEIIERMKIINNPKERPDCEELLRNKNNYFIDLLDLNEIKEKKIEMIDFLGLTSKYLSYKIFYHFTRKNFISENSLQLLSSIINHKIIELNKGSDHFIARSFDGKLYSFGSNEFKQLGYKTESESNYCPKLIESLINENIVEVRCCSRHNLVFTHNGEVFGWGDNSLGQIGINCKERFISIPTKIIGFNGEKIQSISWGSNYTIVFTQNGEVFGWGDNSWGQILINSKERFISIPTKIIGFNDEYNGGQL